MFGTGVTFMYVDVVIRASALKHGLTEAEIREAFYRPLIGAVIRQRDVATDPQRFAMVGVFTSAGGASREAEIIYVLDWKNRPIIFHANYVTKGFLQEVDHAKRRKS